MTALHASRVSNSMMKVLMFGWEFPPYVSGGLGTACYGLTRSMTNQGASILFVVPKANGERQHSNKLRLQGCNEVLPLSEEERDRGVVQTRDLMTFFPVDTLLQPYQNEAQYREYATCSTQVTNKKPSENEDNSSIDIKEQYGKNLISEVIRYSKVGARLAMREDFNVIHAHDWMCYLAGVEAKRHSNKPLVCHVHATEFDRSGLFPDQNIYNIERYGMQQADLVITVSNRTKETVHQRYGIPNEKIRVVHNGVIQDKKINKGDFKHAYKDKLVLFLGRVTMQKGPEYFVRSAALVLKQVPNARFVMAGSGDLLPGIIDLIATLRLQERFHFTGFLSPDDAERMYTLSDVFVMPSVSEPFGITPIEAMKYGVPTIISKQSGVAEVLTNTIKIDFWDINELTRAIIEVLTDEPFSKQMSESGMREVGEITWDKASEKVLSCYGELIAS